MHYNTLKIFIEKIKTEDNRKTLLNEINKSDRLTFLERQELIKLTYSKTL